MALKLNISASDFETLADPIKAEYKKSADGYTLDVSGIEDTTALKRAKQHEAEQRRAAEAEARELRNKVSNLEAGTDDRVTALQTELETTKATLGGENTNLKKAIEATTLNSAAKDIAAKISTSPALMLPHIKSRLAVGFGDDGSAQIAVIGADGKPSKMTLDELGSEFVANKEFSAIIKGSSSSGGAGTRTNPGGAGNPITSPTEPGKNPARMNPRELAAWTAERRAARGEQTGTTE